MVQIKCILGDGCILMGFLSDITDISLLTILRSALLGLKLSPNSSETEEL